PRRARVDGRVPREREAGSEADSDQEGGPEQLAPVGEPGEEEQGGDEREPERHRDEGEPEPRPVRDRREVAVEEAFERELERVLGPEQERENPDLERRDDAEAG